MRAHLTEVTVRSLKSTDRQEKVWDTQTRGFGVRINGTSKSWIVMYGEKRKLRTLGRYPSMSLAVARKEAKKLLAADDGPEIVNITVREAFDEYERTHGREHHGDLTSRYTRRYFNSYVLPEIGQKHLSELNFRRLERLLSIGSQS